MMIRTEQATKSGQTRRATNSSEEERYYAVDPDGKVASQEGRSHSRKAYALSRIEVPGEVDEIVVITGDDGTVTVNFNAEGTYTIEETKAPEGYTGDHRRPHGQGRSSYCSRSW